MSRWPSSKTYLEVITVSPVVVAEVVAVAPELAPVITSLDVNDLALVETYCNGLATVISLPLAPLVPPVIIYYCD